MSQEFEDINEVIKEFNKNRTAVKSETQTSTSGKDYSYVKPQCLAAIGWVGLEFDYIDQIKNLIEEVTEDYNKRVIYYLESALSRLSQLKFCSLPIRGELEECIASIHEQNKSLKEYVSQLEDYVRLVNETEDSIVKQFSTIGCDYVIPGSIPVYEADTNQTVTVADGSAITMELDSSEIEDDGLLARLQDGLSKIGEEVFDAVITTETAPFRALDSLFKFRTSVTKDLNIPQINLFHLVAKALDLYQGERKKIGLEIYKCKLPVISDFVGAYTDTRDKDADSNFFSILGSFRKGVRIDGLEGTIKAMLEMAGDPLGTLEGINEILAYPDKSIPAIKDYICGFIEAKIINGTPEDRANVAGQLVFEIACYLIGIGEVKAAKGAKASNLALKGGEKALLKKTNDWLKEIAESLGKKKSGVIDIDSIANIVSKIDNTKVLVKTMEGLDVKTLRKVLNQLDDTALEKVLQVMDKKQLSELLKDCDGELAKRIKNATERDSKAIKGGSKTTKISTEMEKKILEGQRRSPIKNDVIGGHSSKINNTNDLFAVEELSVNPDGTKNIKFIKDFKDGNISKIKKSTIFPDSWSDSKIIDSIKEVGDSPAISIRARDGATWHRKIINGVEIDVLKLGDDVISGYPTGKVNAPNPSGF